MGNKKWILWMGIILAMGSQGIAQPGLPRELRKGFAAAEEIVSFSQTTSFSHALEVLNDLSKKYMGKIIVDPENHSGPIGVDINRLHWLTALELILRKNNLWYEQYADYIKITPQGGATENMTKEELNALEKFSTREVAISAVFFEADVSKLREVGMSWLFTRPNDDPALPPEVEVTSNASNGLGGEEESSGKLFQIKIDKEFDFGNLSATFDALESENMGEVIASPQVTVGSGEEGRIQVGSDIAVTVQDFAGNAVTQFFSTGSIIKVKPEVIEHDSIDFIYLKLEIERSNSSRSGEGGLEIKKSVANTSVLLLDGEETIIGGLYINEQSNKRTGVPFLKDLPWWFFGLRYVFGFESVSMVKKELLILIHAELLPTLQDRFRAKANGTDDKNVLRRGREKGLEKMDSYRRQIQSHQTGTDK